MNSKSKESKSKNISNEINWDKLLGLPSKYKLVSLMTSEEYDEKYGKQKTKTKGRKKY
jgi:hypothetical protein